MNGLKYMFVITNREFTEQFTDFFKEKELGGVLSWFSDGTATASTLYHLGLEKSEKVTFSVMLRDELVPEIKKELLTRMNLSGAGNGIAVFVPVDGLGGESAKKYLIGHNPIEKREDTNMNDTPSKFVLLITIADKGYTESVMDAARSAGAAGGTVVRAKGTGASIAKFFGVSISEEKEMVYIVSKRETRDNIMRAIMQKAGKDTDAHGVVFSLPVDSVCGIAAFEE